MTLLDPEYEPHDEEISESDICNIKSPRSLVELKPQQTSCKSNLTRNLQETFEVNIHQNLDQSDKPHMHMPLSETSSSERTSAESKSVPSDSGNKTSDSEGCKIDPSQEVDTEPKLPARNKSKSSGKAVKTNKAHIVRSSRASTEKRKWDKYSYCLYCEKKQQKLVRHLVRKHSSEQLVAQALSLPRYGKERKWSGDAAF